MKTPRTSPASGGPAPDWQSTSAWVRRGHRVMAGLGVGLLVFSLVSITGAVVATGVVNVESNYKTVQHLDGGIVAKILVRNGDLVSQGDVLVRLDDTAVRASRQIAASRVNDLLVQQARLAAERDRRAAIVYPAEFEAARAEPALARIIATQEALFAARMSSRRGELEVFRQRLEQVSEETKGLEGQLASRVKEASLNARELAAVKPLYDRGFVNMQRLMPVEREAARLEGEVGRLKAELARSRGAVAEVELKIAQSEKEFTQSVVDELRKVEAQFAEAQEQRTALEDKLRRIDIRAPRSGRVHALQAHTEGGVIQPASPILQVIPDGERLIVEAQIPPQDIDKVRLGQPAGVRFTAFDARLTPRLEGSVANISAAQLNDAQGKSYFTVQIALAEAEITRLPAGRALKPGMPAEVFIETAPRSILSYFVKPLTDALARTFRES